MKNGNKKSNAQLPITQNAVTSSAIKDYLPIFISIISIIFSLPALYLTYTDFQGSRTILFHLQPKEANIVEYKQSTPFLLKPANSEIATTRIHIRFADYGSKSFRTLQLFAPNFEINSDIFRSSAIYIANLSRHQATSPTDGCIGHLPLVIETKYVAKGQVKTNASFYKLVYDYSQPTKENENNSSVILRHLEFEQVVDEPIKTFFPKIPIGYCEWDDTSLPSKDADWSLK